MAASLEENSFAAEEEELSEQNEDLLVRDLGSSSDEETIDWETTPITLSYSSGMLTYFYPPISSSWVPEPGYDYTHIIQYYIGAPFNAFTPIIPNHVCSSAGYVYA